MKKIISLILLIFLIASSSPAQKVNFTLNNARQQDTLILVDVYATVQAGQTWSVGLTNIRIKYWTEHPDNSITLIPDAPVSNANSNLSGNTNYFDMTSSSIIYDSAASLNIQLLADHSPYVMTPTTSGLLGTLRFKVNSNGGCVKMQILPISAVFSNMITPLNYPTDWTFTNSDTCLIYTVGVGAIGATQVPTAYKLYQNYPNPFNPSTTIKYSIPTSGFVSLKVYDILGREIANLVNQQKHSGTYMVDFNAGYLTSGMYFYKLEVNDFVAVKRMVLVK